MNQKRQRVLQKLIQYGKLKGEELAEAKLFVDEAPDEVIDNIRSDQRVLENTIRTIRSLVKNFPTREVIGEVVYRPPLKIERKLLDKTVYLGEGISFEIINLDNTEFIARFITEGQGTHDIKVYNSKYALGKKALQEGAKTYLFYINVPYTPHYRDYLWLTSKNSYLPDLFKKFSIGNDQIVVHSPYALPDPDLAYVLEYYLNQMGEEKGFSVHKIEEF